VVSYAGFKFAGKRALNEDAEKEFGTGRRRVAVECCMNVSAD
jgi:hypothetical protein